MSDDTEPLAPNHGREDHMSTPTLTPYTYVSTVPPEIDQSEEFKQRNNDHVPGIFPVTLQFEECFHEHKSTKTFPQFYNLLGQMYEHIKQAIYHLFVIIFGIFLVLLWGVVNGIFTFIHVWIWGPALKLILFCVHVIVPLVIVPLRLIGTPLVDIAARIFRQIHVQANMTKVAAEKVPPTPA